MLSMTSVRDAFSLYLRRRATAAQVTRELNTMTDAELNDIGISRAAISRLAREAAAGVL